jgi:hypothetical protein
MHQYVLSLLILRAKFVEASTSIVAIVIDEDDSYGVRGEIEMSVSHLTASTLVVFDDSEPSTGAIYENKKLLSILEGHATELKLSESSDSVHISDRSLEVLSDNNDIIHSIFHGMLQQDENDFDESDTWNVAKAAASLVPKYWVIRSCHYLSLCYALILQ